MSHNCQLKRFVLLTGSLLMFTTSLYGLAPVVAEVEPSRTAVQQIQPIPMPAFAGREISPAVGVGSARGRGSTASLNPADMNGTLQIPVELGRSVPWSIVMMLTVLTLVPSILICMTPFARLLIVFHFLRQALGLQTTPSNQTLIGLSVILTFFLMQPVASQIYQEAAIPLQAGQITPIEALGRAELPMHKFMGRYVREKDVALFVELAKEPRPASVDDISMRVLLPAYILSELKAGFEIGTVLFLPFLIVDMVVASITTSVGMLQLPPVVISTPLKLLLFLMVDGWHLLIGSLMRSFG
jgi:flagellar biosynthetic protein FliP